MDIELRREQDSAVIEISGVVEPADREPAEGEVRALLDTCGSRAVLLRLSEPIVTTAALHLLWSARRLAHERGIVLRTSVTPLALQIFRATGLEYLLLGDAGAAA